MSRFTFTIDQKEVSAEENTTILEAALENGVFIPHLCHHKDLRDIGGCGLCVVETGGKTVRACLTKAEPGMTVTSRSEHLDHVRMIAMQLMLAGHIDDCNSCPKYLKCEFQMLIQQQGATVGDLRGTARGLSANTGNPLIVRDLERCIACGRCVRVCADIRKIGALTYADDANGRKIVETKDGLLRDSGCRFCGACVEVCPTGALRDEEGVFAEPFCRGDMLVPCSYECPAHLEIPEYLRYLRNGDADSAYLTIMKRAPLPRSLGNICMSFCENKCRRARLDEPVSICSAKRFAAVTAGNGGAPRVNPPETNGKKVAVVGGGPAGLTSAWLLRLKGYEVTLFEAMDEPGGMMRYGMPEYRLPLGELKEDISTITGLEGITVITGKEITSEEELNGYDAVVWATGASRGAALPLKGAEAPEVFTGLEFLRKIRMGLPTGIGKKVLVLGGGDVAYDCARSAIRLGAEAALCCLEDSGHMTCTDHERRDGTEEGVKVVPSCAFEQIILTDGHVSGLEVRGVRSMSFDADGRLNVEKEEGPSRILECDTILFAVGQKVDIPEGIPLPRDPKGRAVNPGDGGKFYAAGDVVTGTSSVVQAVAWGQKAAAEIDRMLGGDGNVIPDLLPAQKKDPDISGNCLFESLRCTGTVRKAEERICSFEPYVEVLKADEAACQSSRCLQCDLRKELSRPRLYSEFAFKREEG